MAPLTFISLLLFRPLDAFSSSDSFFRSLCPIGLDDLLFASVSSLLRFMDQRALLYVSVALSYGAEVVASSLVRPSLLCRSRPPTRSIPSAPIRNSVKTGSSPGVHLKAVLLTCSEILTAIIIAYKSLRKFNYMKISWWKCAS